MSFSTETKREICRKLSTREPLQYSELYAMLLLGREFSSKSIVFKTENEHTFSHFVFLINKLFSKFTEKIVALLPVVSTIGICMIVATVVSHNAEKIYTCGALVLIVVILHNLLGYGCGFGIGKLFRMTPEKTKALSIEIGMQNSGLATSLATTHFALYPMAAIPGAIFSVWHNFSGSIAASLFRKYN